MKGKREHRIPLSRESLALLDELPRINGSPSLFPSSKKTNRPLSNASMFRLLQRLGRRYVAVHGFRASFSSWAYEQTTASGVAIETSLAHLSGRVTERSYRRGDLLEQRRELMTKWAKFVSTPKVIVIRFGLTK